MAENCFERRPAAILAAERRGRVVRRRKMGCW